LSVWTAIGRWGQVEWVAPAVLAIALAYLVRGRDRLGIALLVAFFVAVLATAATKIAFMAWGVGSAALDFTGISGHAMCAAAIYPLVGASLKWNGDPRSRVPVVLGSAIALAIAFSRVESRAHSPSEVIVGVLLGAAVAWAAVRRGGRPPRLLQPLVVAAAMLLIVAWPAASEPIPNAHSVLTRIALAVSGRAAVYTRADLHRTSAQPGS